MILERHYDEEALIAILNSGDDAVSRDAHLASCAACSAHLEAYQAMSEVLGDKMTWDFSDNFEEGAARGASAIRAIAEKMDSDDAEAKELVAELVTLPRPWWMTTIEADGRYHTTGVLRRLIEVSEEQIDRSPTDAIESAAVAVRLAELLDGGAGVMHLHAAAYRQYAFAVHYVGDAARALEYVGRAEDLLERCPVSEYALARVRLIRALVYRLQNRFSEAVTIARSCAPVFREFGDIQRYVSARLTEAYLLGQAENLNDALPILVELERDWALKVDTDTHARILNNLGSVQRRLGRISDAMQSLQLAGRLFEEMNNLPEAARTRAAVGQLLVGQGNYVEAKVRLRASHAELTRLGMAHTAVMLGLDLAELALLETNFEEVEDLCRAAIRQLETAGLAYTREALTALTFLREAAEQRRATQETVWHVKTYIRRLPDEPALLFAPAPLPPT